MLIRAEIGPEYTVKPEQLQCQTTHRILQKPKVTCKPRW